MVGLLSELEELSSDPARVGSSELLDVVMRLVAASRNLVSCTRPFDAELASLREAIERAVLQAVNVVDGLLRQVGNRITFDERRAMRVKIAECRNLGHNRVDTLNCRQADNRVELGG